MACSCSTTGKRKHRMRGRPLLQSNILAQQPGSASRTSPQEPSPARYADSHHLPLALAQAVCCPRVRSSHPQPMRTLLQCAELCKLSTPKSLGCAQTVPVCKISERHNSCNIVKSDSKSTSAEVLMILCQKFEAEGVSQSFRAMYLLTHSWPKLKESSSAVWNKDLRNAPLCTWRSCGSTGTVRARLCHCGKGCIVRGPIGRGDACG